MSIDPTSSSSVHRKKTLTSTLSQSDNFPFSRHSLKDRLTRSHSSARTMSVSEETPGGDILTDLSTTLPYQQIKINTKRNRRFSELKPSILHDSNSDRRNSISQISLSSLLPNPFRSNKYHHKNTTKDETNTSLHTIDNNSSLHHNDTMTTKTESVPSLKLSNTLPNGSRTNLSHSHDRSPSFIHEDSTSVSSATSSFILDISPSEPRSAETLMLKLHTPLCVGEIYREHFFEYFHTNYCGDFEQEGPFIASLRYFYTKPTITDNTSDTNCQARAIIRIPSRNHDVSVVVNGINEDNILQMLFNKANLSAIHTYKTIGDPKANEKIYLFDKLNDERQNCKVGLIYQGSDQTNEFDIFSNDILTNDLLDFLQILSDRVPLKGFNKYRGDLDIKDDLHGEYSYYTQYQNHEIMFNISPLIPSTKANGQCIERKGLVGNSFVCIVFQEPDAEFLPDFISGKVTQVYITVQPIRIDEQVYYKIGIWHRNDVTSIIDPPGGIYQSDQSFRDYFITLLLNSINVAIESPRLRFRIAEQRQRLKQEELRKLIQNLSIGQILDTVPDVESTKENRSHSRTDSPASSTTESISSNTGRMSPAATSKKRTFSKIFGVFTGSSKSTSNSSHPPNLTISIPPNINDISPVNPPSPELKLTKSRTLPSPNKEPIKRAASVKIRPAPPPPVPPRIPVSQTLSLASTQSLSSSSQSSLSNDTNLSSAIISEEPRRHRSNSSPDDKFNTTLKFQSLTGSRISEEIDDTSSSAYDDSSEDEHIARRETVTEPPLA